MVVAMAMGDRIDAFAERAGNTGRALDDGAEDTFVAAVLMGVERGAGSDGAVLGRRGPAAGSAVGGCDDGLGDDVDEGILRHAGVALGVTEEVCRLEDLAHQQEVEAFVGVVDAGHRSGIGTGAQQ
ncbi:MAG TPA: hypothetical protein VGF99_03190 [Myxococcota bacterium]